MVKFKVWLEIERVDYDNIDNYEDGTLWTVSVGEYDSLEEADQVIINLTGKSSL